ncbi:uncharacterized protein [Miscanthus floridulus]|uniref:uncharacterized protein isoform X2 n=1 Tax=Miscanthus floridulus TaxID=154761 RepID=UPI00345ADEBB
MRRAGDASSGRGGADAAAISPAREEQMWWRGTSDSSSTAKHIFQMLEAIVGRVIVLWQTHMLEEIRQLKEHSRMQDKVIEELKNNQRHHENQEATMENFARSDHNNSQNQAVLSKRKRVHCVAPNQNDGFLEHRDELGHHGGPRETMTIAHQEVAHDKVTCNKRQAPKQLPVMKVNVAYATLLSTDPEAIVGGVKTGNQFYKVRIDHAITKDEPLVRPRPVCNNIGDAQAKGVSIAWPSMFVQMIND